MQYFDKEAGVALEILRPDFRTCLSVAEEPDLQERISLWHHGKQP